MGGSILDLKGLRTNPGNQCIPITLFVVIQNQFRSEKRTNLAKATYKQIKAWTDWGHKLHKLRASLDSTREKRVLDELYQGNWNIETFHQDLNNNINNTNSRLAMQAGFSSNDIKKKIDEGIFPMMVINPIYINGASYSNVPKKIIRGEPPIEHFIAIHGYRDEELLIYDCDLNYGNGEILNENNIRCHSNITVLKKHSTALNRLYLFELMDKTSETKIPQFANG